LSNTVRIIKGKTAVFEASLNFVGDGDITISNNVVSTPKIVLELDSNRIKSNGSLLVSADVSDIEDFSCYWAVDGKAVTAIGEYSDFSYPVSGLSIGDHEVSLFIKTANLIWSESESFNVVKALPNFEIGEVDSSIDFDNMSYLLCEEEGNAFSIRKNNDTLYVVYYPKALETYYRSLYGWYPNTGNPFHRYYSCQLGMDIMSFIKALASKSIELPYPDYTDSHSTHPYILSDASSIPEENFSSVQSIYDEDKGYFRDYETDEVFEFPSDDRFYVGVSKGGSYRYYLLLAPERVIRVYNEKYPEKTYEEKYSMYFQEKYGLNVLDDNGEFNITKEQILMILNEYKQPE